MIFKSIFGDNNKTKPSVKSMIKIFECLKKGPQPGPLRHKVDAEKLFSDHFPRINECLKITKNKQQQQHTHIMVNIFENP